MADTRPVVFFDLDGTLSDYYAAASAGLDAAYSQLQAAGLAIRKDRFIARYWERFSHRRDDPDPNSRLQRFVLLVADLAIPHPELALVLDRNYQQGRVARPYPIQGLHAVLRQLHRRCRLAVITDGPALDQRKQLELLEIGNYFEDVIISGEWGWRKPALELFALALQRLQVQPQAAVMIGDSPYLDLKTPHELGMKTIFFSGCTTWRWSRQELSGFVDKIAPSLEIIPELLVQLFYDKK